MRYVATAYHHGMVDTTAGRGNVDHAVEHHEMADGDREDEAHVPGHDDVFEQICGLAVTAFDETVAAAFARRLRWLRRWMRLDQASKSISEHVSVFELQSLNQQMPQWLSTDGHELTKL